MSLLVFKDSGSGTDKNTHICNFCLLVLQKAVENRRSRDQLSKLSQLKRKNIGPDCNSIRLVSN